ncbi:hypothetical protein VTO73DRAFT_15070 [Trametes versicolor]
MSGLSSTKLLRLSLRRAARSTRNVSTESSASSSSSTTTSTSQSKVDVQPNAKLPDEKMRVLVNLYHQSASFITKENLSKRIDEAFIHRQMKRATALGDETPFRALEVALTQRRAMPRFGESNTATVKTNSKAAQAGEAWSENRPLRELAVMTTLYGVLSRGRPGFDALKDEEARTKRRLAEDRQASEGSS